MRKKTIILIFIVVLLIGADVFLFLNKDKLKPQPTTQEKEPQKEAKLNELTGIIYALNENNLTILANNKFYNTANLHNFDYKIGNFVKVMYQNDITKPTSIELTPAAYQDEGLFKNYYEQAVNKMQELTLDEKIAQLFLVRVPEAEQKEAITNYGLGGYILFGRDTKNETKESLINKINSFQQAAKIPLLIATDEEGGTVVRISNNPNLRSSIFASPQQIYAEGGFTEITNTTKEMNSLLAELGINVNLAPVADVSTNADDFIYKRSFGQNASLTAEYISTVLEAGKDSKVSNVLKHFPGYGNNVDTHTDVSLDNRSLDSLQNNDLIPFKTGIDHQAEAIMVSHNIITALDPINPASLSLSLHQLARNDLGFSGILMTDDLDMEAVVKKDDNSIVDAILAGNNILILSDYKKALNDIKNAINEDVFTEDLINYNAVKVLAWKYYKGIIS